VSGSGSIETQRSYVVLDSEVNKRSTRCFMEEVFCWYYTGSQVYRYKLGKDDLYTSTVRFVRDKPMTQVGVA